MEENSVSNGTTNGTVDNIGNNEDIVCRDFLRNVCTRGSRCKFKHPSSDESRLVSLQRIGGLTFCHDFQNTQCNRPSCKFIHGSRQDEEHYRATGELPKHVLSAAVHKGIIQDTNSDGDIPLCKDFLKGECHRGKKCKFRHIELIKSDFRDRQERPEDFELPEAKRRHYEDNEFNLRYTSRHYDYLPYYRDRQISPPPNQRSYNSLGNPSPASHIPVIGVCNQLELRMLQEENILLRRKVEDLKKQVSDLMATNEFLLEQNAHLRIHSKLPAASTVATVTLPAVTIANSMTIPATTSVPALGQLTPIPAVQTVQATATLPLVTAQSTQTLNASIPIAGSVSLAQPTPLATVSIAPVNLNQTTAMAAQAPSLSAAAATVTLTPTISATALQLGPNTGLSISGANAGSLVSYPIMTQSLMPPTLQNSMTH